MTVACLTASNLQDLGICWDASAAGTGAVVARVNVGGAAYGKVAVGQVLLGINGECVRKMSYREAVDKVTGADCPITLYFGDAADTGTGKENSDGNRTG